jgi:hypothetical protein
MELTVNEYYEKFSLCAQDGDLNALVKIRGSLYKQRQKMDSWFDKYLEMMDKRMDVEKTNTPEWKMYNKKFEEYSDLNRVIASAEQYIRKVSGNV